MEIGYPLRSPIRSRSVLKTHKKTPMYGLISTHSYRIGNKGKFHNHESDVDTLFMEYRVGRTIRGSEWPAETDTSARHDICRLVVETLAALHAVDPAAVGLGDFGRPDGFLERAVRGWAKRATIATDGIAGGPTEEVASWLETNLTPGGAATMLHNDFKLDNMLFAEDDWRRPVAVLDWDQATRGDPLFDLATLLSYWSEPGDPQAMMLLDQMPTGAPGSMTRAEARDLYAEITGRDLSDFRFFRAPWHVQAGGGLPPALCPVSPRHGERSEV